MNTKLESLDRVLGSSVESDSKILGVVQMRTTQTMPTTTETRTHTAVSNTVQATTITVVLEEIVNHDGYLHGGINE